ncbi:MAG: hypothetical protein IKQ49_03390 [Eubacterium sp.]|nr:hypothetical protein [Eubacterium sp.]
MNTRRISLRSLFFYLLRRFWVVILMAVCMGVLLAGYKYYKDKQSLQKETEVNDGSKLTVDEKSNVENAAMQYEYMKEIEKYYNESPLMSHSANKEPQTIVEYRVLYDTPDGSQSYGTIENTYIQLLRSYINDGMYIRDLEEKDPAYTKFTYIKELTWCSSAGNGVFTMGVIENKKVPNLAADLRSVTEAYMKKLEETQPGLSITVMKEGSIEVYDATTDSAQKSALSTLITYRKAYMNAYVDFTASQKAYFSYLVSGKKAEQEEEKEAASPRISLKYAAVGVVIGGVAGLGLVLVLLYLSLRHASISDFSENAGLRGFGMLYLKDEKGKKHGLMRREMKEALFDTNEESIRYAAVRIGGYCRKYGITELTCLSSRSSEVVEKAVQELEKALKKENITLLSSEKVATDSKALARLLSAKYGIFLEELHGGNRKKLRELQQFCEENEVMVIGSLGVAALTLG